MDTTTPSPCAEFSAINAHDLLSLRWNRTHVPHASQTVLWQTSGVCWRFLGPRQWDGEEKRIFEDGKQDLSAEGAPTAGMRLQLAACQQARSGKMGRGNVCPICSVKLLIDHLNYYRQTQEAERADPSRQSPILQALFELFPLRTSFINETKKGHIPTARLDRSPTNFKHAHPSTSTTHSKVEFVDLLSS